MSMDQELRVLEVRINSRIELYRDCIDDLEDQLESLRCVIDFLVEVDAVEKGA